MQIIHVDKLQSPQRDLKYSIDFAQNQCYLPHGQLSVDTHPIPAARSAENFLNIAFIFHHVSEPILCVDKILSPPRRILCVDKIKSQPRRILCVDKITSQPARAEDFIASLKITLPFLFP